MFLLLLTANLGNETPQKCEVMRAGLFLHSRPCFHILKKALPLQA